MARFFLFILIIPILIFSCDPMDDYESFGDPPTPESCFCDPEGVEAYLKWLWSEYPDVTDLRIIGESETGRNLYVLEISDNAGDSPSTNDAEDEPAVLVNGGIHGHEQIGTGVPMKLAEHLLRAYYDTEYDITAAERTQAVYIVDNFKLHIMPALNPDGLQDSSRYNDNGVDLNRNFGWNWDSADWNNGDTAFDQAESAAIRDDFAENGYCLSLNLHTASEWQDYRGGGVGIYAPWDAITTDTPSFETLYLQNYGYIENLGTAYAAAVVAEDIYPIYFYFHYDEGADWYEFGGSMADWALGTHGTVSYSIELYGMQNFTTEDSYLLQQTWDANRQAMIDLILAAEQGTGGRVVDNFGDPIQGAEITLDQTGGSRAPALIEYPDLKAITDENGRFRLLTGEGSYNISIEKEGYTPIESTSIAVTTTPDGSRGLTGGMFCPEYVLTFQ